MDYGNVPQNRERVYIIGFKGESEYKGCPDDKNICSSAFNFPSPLERTEQIADILEKKKVNSKYYYRNSLYFRQLSRTTWRKDTVYQWRRVYLRENKSNVCPTLTANMGTGGHNVPLICKSAIRKLTPRECARLQGFPEEFIFPVKMAQSHIYKQIGNSVTVPVIRRIAEKIKEALDVKYSYRIIPVNNTEKEALKIALVS
jgi:DNA (cytosine-5)-methyltransferase 1